MIRSDKRILRQCYVGLDIGRQGEAKLVLALPVEGLCEEEIAFVIDNEPGDVSCERVELELVR